MGNTSGVALPYDLDGEVSTSSPVWKVHRGHRRGGDKARVTVFVHTKSPENKLAGLARNCMSRLKITKHPNILAYVDGSDTDKQVLLVTEPAVPLATWLEDHKEESDATLHARVAWGTASILKALAFIGEGSMVHANVNPNSIFVTQAGEWKLGGFELCCTAEQLESKVSEQRDFVNTTYAPPEAKRNNPVDSSKPWTWDVFSLACVVFRVLNGSFMSHGQLSDTGKIPATFQPSFTGMTQRNPRRRPSPADIGKCKFVRQPFVRAINFLDSIALKEDSQKHAFFTKLTPLLPGFPADACKYKILPEILSALDYAGLGNVALPPMFAMAEALDAADFESRVAPVIVKLFARPNRAVRMSLLKHLPAFVNHLAAGTINDNIFPSFVTGFTDTAAPMREATLQASLLLAPKLESKNLNGTLLRFLKKLTTDPEGPIRVNTVILLGRLASHLRADTRDAEVMGAFAKAMRDPYGHVRLAALRGILATYKLFNPTNVCKQLIPRVCPLLSDPWADARDTACKVLSVMSEYFLQLSKARAAQEQEAAATNAGGSGSAAVASTPAAQAAGAVGGAVAGALGWAVSSWSKGGGKQSSPSAPAPAPAPAAAGGVKSSAQTPAAASGSAPLSSSSRQSSGSSSNGASRVGGGGGMRLSGATSSRSTTASAPAPAPAPAASGWDDDWGMGDEDPKPATLSLGAKSPDADGNAGGSSGWDDDWGLGDITAAPAKPVKVLGGLGGVSPSAPATPDRKAKAAADRKARLAARRAQREARLKGSSTARSGALGASALRPPAAAPAPTAAPAPAAASNADDLLGSFGAWGLDQPSTAPAPAPAPALAPAAAAAGDASGWGDDFGWGADEDSLDLGAPAPAPAPTPAPAPAPAPVPASLASPLRSTIVPTSTRTARRGMRLGGKKAPKAGVGASQPAKPPTPVSSPTTARLGTPKKVKQGKPVVTKVDAAEIDAAFGDGWGDDW